MFGLFKKKEADKRLEKTEATDQGVSETAEKTSGKGSCGSNASCYELHAEQDPEERTEETETRCHA